MYSSPGDWLHLKGWTSKFQEKCIVAELGCDIDENIPKIGLEGKAGFSVKTFEVTAEVEVDVTFAYDMPDGSICKEVKTCGPEGTVIHNTQCGGATAIRFFLPTYNKVKVCKIGIHKIEFNCGPPTIPPTISIPAPPQETQTVNPTESIPSPPYPTGPAPTGPAPTGGVPSLTTSTVYSTSEITITSCGPEVTNCPASSTVVVTTEIPVSTTICPVTDTEPVPVPTDVPSPSQSGGIPGQTGVPSETPVPSPSQSGGIPGQTGVPSETVNPTESTPAPTAPTTIITSSTSTVYSTSEMTVTSCAPGAPSCPSDSTVIVTSIVPISTTICPVTLTQTGGVPVPTEGTPVPTEGTPVPTEGAPGSTSGVEPTQSTPGAPVPVPTTYVTQSTSTVYTTSMMTVTSCPPGTPNCPSDSTVVVTSTIALSTTICPVTLTQTGIPTQVPAPTYGAPGSTSGVEPTQVTPGAPAPSAPAPTGSVPAPAPGSPTPQLPAQCPPVVPKCLNTWITIPKCSSNSDISCFCPSPEFTDKAIQCIRSWGSSDAEVQAALTCFTAICIEHIPKNPGIVTAIPPSITLGPMPVTSVPGGPAPTTIPQTTIEVPQVITGTDGGVTSTSTMITVPHIGFTTAPGPNPSVILAPGPAPATTTDGGVSPTQVPGGSPPYGSTGFMTVSQTGTAPRPTSTIEPYIGAASSLESLSSRWIVMGMTAIVGMLQFAL
ncbi:extracellular serine-threonine rich protein [Arthroderma uncinatum]|uniref:extracellular serine-threonine rich protein n=1 Tax=Arthroderma uncinatum TaxID=74035 RepID=UPI00144AA017|nr:extracellular serine-threonine rich protein [Arthroderma uncinatum]KAF3492259.1 extracellular serine-threonine rich protein [Arthroderma uncinatum]